MDKSAIRSFSIEARRLLMKSAETEAGFYGVTRKGCNNPIQKGNDFEVYKTLAGTENRIYGTDIKRRENLVKAVEVLGFDQVMEETAYTWFNRIIAIRFMEVNDYLPTRVRVLSSETGSSTPDIVTKFLDVELNMTTEELEIIQKSKDENRYDDAFRFLFIKQCNELNKILPGLFEKTDDYMELLLKLSYTSDGVIRMLIDTVAEDNFNVETEGQVEIIGWMYQYYNTELKDDTFAKLKKNIKITKERIPAVTQLFTPDWIVRYMVENSVGRVWIEHLRAVDSSVDEKSKAEEFGWKYYLPEAEQKEDAESQLIETRNSYKNLTPMDISCIDPCMGSGHILVYMFDVLMDIYKSEGFNERNSVFYILSKNIHGLDIDRRAYQLSYFALMMKARGYSKSFFRGIEDNNGNRLFVNPLLFSIEESNSINRNQLIYFGDNLEPKEKEMTRRKIDELLDSLKDAKEFGSILNIASYDWKLLLKYISYFDVGAQITFNTFGIDDTQQELMMLLRQAKVMATQYYCVVTNPPYMGLKSGMTSQLAEFVKKKFPESKSDMYSVFIDKCMKMTKKLGYTSMLTQHSWMFQSSFKKLRINVLNNMLINLLHLGARAFDEIGGEVVQTAAYVIKKVGIKNYRGTYARLVYGSDQNEKKHMYLNKEEIYITSTENFLKTDEKIISYWLSNQFYHIYENKKIKDIAYTFQGIITGKTEKYLRLWFEPAYSKIKFNETNTNSLNSSNCYYPYIKGGGFRRWYGNLDYVIHWEKNGLEYVRSRTENRNYFFSKGVTWSDLCTGKFSCRYVEEGYLFDASGPMLFANNNRDINMLCGYFNSKVFQSLLDINSQGLHYGNGAIASQPVILGNNYIDDLVKSCIEISKEDWNQNETSWDFKKNPLIVELENIEKDNGTKGTIKEAFEVWKKKCEKRFDNLKKNEEEINKIVIALYGLSNELDEKISNSEISVLQADYERDVKNFISYAIGCMFGRYSLNKEGICYAGGKWISSYYLDYNPVEDGIIPITDEQYLRNDIVELFISFINTVSDEKYLEENLMFIANGLNIRNESSRETIRKYFLNEFFKTHCSMYSSSNSGKRPIYWLFDSGKKNGFKALIYVHRYNRDMVGLIRSEYFRKIQEAIEVSLKNVEYIISTSSSTVDKARATKSRDKYIKQLIEIRTYYQALSHIALQRIEIDLDDGIKTNYAKFQEVEVSNEGTKKQIIDLLAKI